MKYLIWLTTALCMSCGPAQEAMPVPEFEHADYEFIDNMTLRCEDRIWNAEEGIITCRWICATYKDSSLPMKIKLVFPVDMYPLDVQDLDGNGVGDWYFTGEIKEDLTDCATGNI